MANLSDLASKEMLDSFQIVSTVFGTLLNCSMSDWGYSRDNSERLAGTLRRRQICDIANLTCRAAAMPYVNFNKPPVLYLAV